MKSQQKDKERKFWNSQAKNRYAAYEKKVYSAFREKEYMEIIKRGLSGFDYKKNGRVLDIGCGAGVSSIVLSNMGFDVTGVDISSNLISQAEGLCEDKTVQWLTPSGKIENKPKFMVGDIAKLDFETQSADICFLTGVLHHFQDYSGVLDEVHKVLKKGGIMIACEPNLTNLPYRLSYYLVNRKKGVSPNEFPLFPSKVEKDLKRYFKDVRLYPFRENDVPFLRQMGWFGRSIFGDLLRIIILFFKNTFGSRYTKGTFFIAGCQK